MRDLDDIRKDINAADAGIVPLFEKRMRAAGEVADFKKARGMEIFQAAREDEVKKRAVGMLEDKSFASETEDLMTAVMDISKLYQLRRTVDPSDPYEREPFDAAAPVAYQGVAGSFSSQAVAEFFGEGAKASAYPTFASVCDAIESGEAKYGVLPLENSTIGSVVEAYDLLGARSMYIVGEQWVQVKHALVGCDGADESTVRKVYSKAEALAQCSEYLGGRDWELIPYANTAAAAKMVAEMRDVSVAAVASESAAKLYVLDVIACPVNTEKDNYTRFIVIAKKLTDAPADKVTVSFGLDNERGALYRMLGIFARLGINMSKIESRPDKSNPAKYYFVADLEGNCGSPEMKCALSAARSASHDFRFLGEYRKGRLQ